MRTTITIESERGDGNRLVTVKDLYDCLITQHYLDEGTSLTLTTGAWPIRIESADAGQFPR